MLTLGKFSIVRTDELEETFFQDNATIAALEKRIDDLQTMLDNSRTESVNIHQALTEAQRENAQLQIANAELKAANTELEKDLLQLQAATFASLPSTNGDTAKMPAPKRTGRRKAVTS